MLEFFALGPGFSWMSPDSIMVNSNTVFLGVTRDVGPMLLPNLQGLCCSRLISSLSRFICARFICAFFSP
jgi:hypothetical protein